MSPPKQWTFTESMNYTPGGILRLGQILTQARNPAGARITKEGDLVTAGIQIDKSCHDFRKTQSGELEARWKSWVKLSGIPLAGAIFGSWSRKRLEDWSAEELHGEIMPLDDASAQSMLNDANVISYTRQRRGFFGLGRGTGKLFMVTGIRWAKGGRLNDSEQTGGEGGASVRGNRTQTGAAPLEARGEGGVKYNTQRETAITRATDFVYQYALHELKYGLHYKARPYTYGQTEMDSGDEEAQPNNKPSEIESLEFRGWDAVAAAPPQAVSRSDAGQPPPKPGGEVHSRTWAATQPSGQGRFGLG